MPSGDRTLLGRFELASVMKCRSRSGFLTAFVKGWAYVCTWEIDGLEKCQLAVDADHSGCIVRCHSLSFEHKSPQLKTNPGIV